MVNGVRSRPNLALRLAHRRPARPRPQPRRRTPGVVPGLLVVAASTGVAFAVSCLLPAVPTSTVAVALGLLVVNLGLHRPVLHAGTRVASRHLLQFAVVLLGLQLSLRHLAQIGVPGLAVVVGTVAVTFTGTRLLGRMLKVPRARSLLVATGFSICGASAIAAMEKVTDRHDDDVPAAVALVTLYGSLGIALLPLLRGPLGLDPFAFAEWVGASVSDIGQTVATAGHAPGTLQTAVTVKLARVALLAPLVAAVAVAARRTAAQPETAARRPPGVPLFLVGFLVAVVLASTDLIPERPALALRHVQDVLLVAALFGLGTGIHLPTLWRTGGRTLALGLASWLLVTSTAYAGVRLLGH
ncbi:YeiH family protein [Micromonospora okii]|uniref:YeiH family protein n=1 Tax=Micromonospora okii TaxID=1182970 RepID=UPI00279549BB|nr:putative sulfate exporter family transporter [Micromonospora okii]